MDNFIFIFVAIISVAVIVTIAKSFYKDLAEMNEELSREPDAPFPVSTTEQAATISEIADLPPVPQAALIPLQDDDEDEDMLPMYETNILH